MNFGLVSFGNAMGDRALVADVVTEHTEDVERLLSYGYEHVYRCPQEVGLTDLAERACRAALDAAGCSLDEVDLLVLAVTDIAEYLYWDAAAALAHRLGLVKAEAVLMTQACTTGVMAFDTVAGKFATHERYGTALVVAANRTCDAYWNRMDVQPMVFSDGACAAVARRDHRRLRWLATEVITDGSFAGFFRMDVGGAAAPFGPGVTSGQQPRVRDAWDIMEFFDFESDRFEDYARRLDLSAKEVLERACARAGTKPDELSRAILLGDNAAAMAGLADLIGISLERTNFALVREHGHFGAADQLFCLGEWARQGVLAEGERLALLSRGRGMHWACTLLEG